MHEPDPFSDPLYEEQTHLAERELSSFIVAVAKLYGPDQARLSAEDWLEESELIDSPPRSVARNWGAVTIAASARLANRMHARDGSRGAPANQTEYKNSGDTIVELFRSRIDGYFPILRQ